ncbi:hypothetical protein ACO0RG_004771 [Hanseniaspora osmophila]|uniref:Shuttling pre-60S factor ECM1 n=1 Tax=Hanseniaspora osmophila TaxID=56408 RepID=A0A1E5RZT1_9ASCO|nr:Shuttling pre-60S factor ECM1 [Hanseniaspora osmophila]
MAKKISKHSRAARKAEAEVHELKELADLPRAAKTDITGSLIRTASKNEDLLNRKMERKQRGKNRVGKNSSRNELGLKDRLKNADIGLLEQEKLQKSLNFTNVLDGKISKSISRAKYVQGARKAGWDATNSRIREELQLVQGPSSSAKAAPQNKETSEEVDQVEQEMEPVVTFGDLEEQEKQKKLQTNSFGSLENDVEA